jgi:hypothetical protein
MYIFNLFGISICLVNAVENDFILLQKNSKGQYLSDINWMTLSPHSIEMQFYHISSEYIFSSFLDFY